MAGCCTGRVFDQQNLATIVPGNSRCFQEKSIKNYNIQYKLEPAATASIITKCCRLFGIFNQRDYFVSI
jgi:hypothetical protein